MELDSADKKLLQRAYVSLSEANAIMHFLSEHFRDKYGLTQENQITPDGQIITKSALDGTQILSAIQGESGD